MSLPAPSPPAGLSSFSVLHFTYPHCPVPRNQALLTSALPPCLPCNTATNTALAAQVRAAYAAVSALGHELLALQQAGADFGAALDAVGTRGELAEVRRRLEAHQSLLAAWEEKVAAQLEAVAELQSPSKRNSMLRASVTSAALLAAGGGVELLRGSGASSAFGSAFAVLPPVAAAAAAAAAGGGSGGLLGAFGTAASAPSSPVGGWGMGSPLPSGKLVAEASRRSAFTPGPALTGMGDVTPPGGVTPR